jgi:RNA polymerase sigma-70 factor (ECF subfamily)
MPNSKQSGSQSDDSLLKKYQGGEREAATQLYARYATRLLDLAQRRTGQDLTQRVDPEDVVQSVFRTFFRRAAEGSYEVPDGDTLWKLLMVIALNKIRSLADFHRADKRDVRRTQGMLAAEGELGQHDSLDMLRLTIEDLTQDLPEAHKQMIQLRIEGYAVSEIAEKVARSKRSTERVLQSFRTLLMNELKAAGVEDLAGEEVNLENLASDVADEREP